MKILHFPLCFELIRNIVFLEHHGACVLFFETHGMHLKSGYLLPCHQNSAAITIILYKLNNIIFYHSELMNESLGMKIYGIQEEEEYNFCGFCVWIVCLCVCIFVYLFCKKYETSIQTGNLLTTPFNIFTPNPLHFNCTCLYVCNCTSYQCFFSF